MAPRLYHPLGFEPNTPFALTPVAARHAQVLRLQPGSAITLFGWDDCQWQGQVVSMGRSEVIVSASARENVNLETRPQVHLAIALIANERMDFLIEKATELGAASFSPLMAERCVMRLSGERAEKRVQHWQSIAVAACEQSGRNTVPKVYPVQTLAHYLKASLLPGSTRLLLSLNTPTSQLAHFLPPLHTDPPSFHLLSGTEGGWTAQEEALARASQFTGATLGPRVLRADTAPLAALAALTLSFPSSHSRLSEQGTP